MGIRNRFPFLKNINVLTFGSDTDKEFTHPQTLSEIVMVHSM